MRIFSPDRHFPLSKTEKNAIMPTYILDQPYSVEGRTAHPSGKPFQSPHKNRSDCLVLLAQALLQVVDALDSPTHRRDGESRRVAFSAAMQGNGFPGCIRVFAYAS